MHSCYVSVDGNNPSLSEIGAGSTEWILAT